MSKITLVVTDYVETDLDWEAGELSRRGIRFGFHQLRTAPAQDVIAATREADIVIANFTPIAAEIVRSW